MAVILVAAGFAYTTPASAASLPSGFSTHTLVSGLSFPTGVTWAPDGRMFIATKTGQVYATDANGLLNTTPIIDISSQVNNDGDRGLLGIAVDSQYPTQPYLYLLYTYNAVPSNTTVPEVSQLRRVVLNADSSVPDPAGQVILGTDTTTPCPTDNTVDCIPSDGSSHSIGTVRSDPDGTLWVGSGDGANFDDVDTRAFRSGDENSLAGKVMHVDRNGHGLPSHPFCPSDATLTDNCTKLYAMGFRNPFRFTLRAGAGPAVADVGWNGYEEFDLLQAGGDYGWPCLEGTHPSAPGYDDDPSCSPPNGRTLATTQSPVFEYAHNGSSAATVGGPTYAGGGYPSNYVGSTFFGDYVTGTLRRYDPNRGSTTTFGTDAKPWVDLETAPSGLSYIHAGDLVYVDIGVNFQPGAGAVGTIAYDSSIASAPVARASASPTQVSHGLSVNFTGSASSDADGDTLHYSWDFGDGSPPSALANPQHTYTSSGAYTATLTVTDPTDKGATDTATVPVVVDGPRVTLTQPTANSLYQDGSPVSLEGSAVDAGSKSIDDANLRWQVILHHGPSHVHQLGWFPNHSQFTPLVDHGADSWYDVTLYATDANGLTGWTTESVFPDKVNLTVASNPAGAPITYVGRSLVAPFTSPEAKGFHGSLSAADQFVAGDGGTYAFDSWSDGGPRNRTLIVGNAPVNLTANYHRIDAAPAGVTTAGGAVTGAGAFKPPPVDRRGPDLRIGAVAAGLRRGVLSATAVDPSGVRKVDVSVRLRHRNRTCRWWSTSRHRLGVPRTCTTPAWTHAKLTGRSWIASLGAALPRGSYLVYVRATDRRGNTTTQVIAVQLR